MLVLLFFDSLVDFLVQRKQLILHLFLFSLLFLFAHSLLSLDCTQKQSTKSIETNQSNKKTEQSRMRKESVAKLRHKVTDSCTFLAIFFSNIYGRVPICDANQPQNLIQFQPIKSSHVAHTRVFFLSFFWVREGRITTCPFLTHLLTKSLICGQLTFKTISHIFTYHIYRYSTLIL